MTTLANVDFGSRLAQALDAWRLAVGESHVIVDQDALSAAATATFATTRQVSAIVQPADCEELQQCVRIANDCRIAVYPVSCGKNWGYGSRVPVQDRSVVLDLGRMNRITNFNETMAHVTVEPGVTLQQMYDYLVARRSELIMSITGSSPHSSIIGNVVERGVGPGRYGDRWNHVCALEVVLPTGECIHTGFGRFEHAAATHISRGGVGPWLDGLFTQSRLGIVSRLTMWLYPRPKHFQVFLGWMNDDVHLERFVDSARKLRLEGTIDNTLAAFNDFRTLTFTHKYPWHETDGVTPLPEPFRLKFRQQSRSAKWMALGALYSPSRAQGRADRKRVRQVLRGSVNKLLFINGPVAQIGRWIHKPYQWLTGIDLAAKMDSLYYKSAFLGVPTNEGIASMYWRKKTETPPAPHDLDRDRCGVLFLGEVVPCEGEHVSRAMRTIEATMLSHGFEPVVNLSTVGERTMHIIVVIVYDRETPGEDERAALCHEELISQLAGQGYLPYRHGIDTMQLLPPPRDDYEQLMRTLREALDPHNILAPGRYDVGD